MNNRALTLSLVMAVFAVFFVQSYVTSIEDEAKKKFGTEILAIVAKKDIGEMKTITETMLEFKRIPKRYLEPAAISVNQKEQNEKSQMAIRAVAGSIAIVPIKEGEQLTYNKITEAGMRTGLAPQIAPGRRAISIPVTETTGVSKLVKPGDRVDLIAIMDLGRGKENKIAKTILQDVIVLSIGRYITNNAARVIEADSLGGKDRVRSLAEDFAFSSVTLEVEPAQAQALALILQSGDNAMTLSLRNNDDTARSNLPGVMLKDILGADAARAPAEQGGGGRQRR